MNIHDRITPSQFLGMIKIGAQQIIQYEQKLNQLNVFPVTDHDTGTNLASMMRYVSSQIYQVNQLDALINQLKEAFLYGASGNSGMIFSSFISGFGSHPELSKQTEFTLPFFKECLALGKEHAYQAVEEPLEGTMLSIFNVWANAYTPIINDFKAFFSRCSKLAQDALAKTEHQINTLTENHVIDAGALGVQLFIKGMYDYLINPKDEIDLAIPPIQKETYPDTHEHEVESHYTYCMETILDHHTTDCLPLKKLLHQYGDSIVITEAGHHQKIHIHTNDPILVTHELKQRGHIQYQKVDNMKLQWETSHARKHPIAIVTDSTADIPPDWIQAEHIHVIPIQIKMNKNNLLDGITVKLDTLYKEMEDENTYITTASPSPLLISRQLNYLLSKYDSIIILTLASKLSSTHQVIAQEAKKINSDAITVIDSLRNSIAQGLLVMAACKLIAAKLSHKEIVAQLLDLRLKTSAYLIANDLTSIARSGRVKDIINTISHFSKIKPIITLNDEGKPSLASISFGEMMSWKKISKLIQKTQTKNNIDSIMIVHTAAEEKAKSFAAYIHEHTGLSIQYILEASASMGLHLGKDCLAIAWIPEYTSSQQQN